MTLPRDFTKIFRDRCNKFEVFFSGENCWFLSAENRRFNEDSHALPAESHNVLQMRLNCQYRATGKSKS